MSPTDLRVLREATLAHVLAGAAGGSRFEASGVLAAGGCLWVAFDNLPDLARISLDWTVPDAAAGMIRQPGGPTGFEDLAADPDGERYFGVLEGVDRGDGHRYSQIVVFDHRWREVDRQWTDIRLIEPNKGLEGLAAVRRHGRLHLLGLAEGPVDVAATRTPGVPGRLHVLVEVDGQWRTRHTVALPESVRFGDYSAVALDGSRLAVLSQESSALWVGSLHPDRWRVLDDGRTYRFPRSAQGRICYGTVEGAAWLDDRRLVVVSDRAKHGAPQRIRDKDQSIHVVELP